MGESNEDIPDDLITPPRAARLVHAHVSAIYRWIQTKRIRSWRRGGARFLVSAAEVRRQLEPYRPDSLPRGKSQTPPSNGGLAEAKRYLESVGLM